MWNGTVQTAEFVRYGVVSWLAVASWWKCKRYEGPFSVESACSPLDLWGFSPVKSIQMWISPEKMVCPIKYLFPDWIFKLLSQSGTNVGSLVIFHALGHEAHWPLADLWVWESGQRCLHGVALKYSDWCHYVMCAVWDSERYGRNPLLSFALVSTAASRLYATAQIMSRTPPWLFLQNKSSAVNISQIYQKRGEHFIRQAK